jgi:cytoskeleton protein RodZ
MTGSDNSQDELDLNFHTDIPVGEILRRTRNHYGQTLPQIESVLRIRASQLDALERGDIAQLPGRVYAIGFVRAYSEYLGLDGDKMVYLFKEQSVGRKAKPDLSFPVPASETKVPNLIIIAASIAGFLLVIGFASFLFLPDRVEPEIPPVPDALTTLKLSEAPALVGDAGAVDAVEDGPSSSNPASTPAEPEKPKNRIVLEIVDASWIEIKNADGAAILRQVLKAGDIYLVPDEPGLMLSTGNAGGIRVKVDGENLPPLGEAGAIRRNLKLEPAALRSLPKPPPDIAPMPQPAPPQALPPPTPQTAPQPAPRPNMHMNR